MGLGSSLECCSNPRRGCEVDSLFGEDDFFREARWDDFYECQEGSSEHDDLFHAAQEQAWLKCTKGTLAASYASFELQRRARRAISAISNLSGDRGRVTERSSAPSAPSAAPVRFNSSVEVTSTRQWLGKTMTQWTKGSDLPPTGEGPYWAQGDGKGLMVRQGPNYKKFRNKGESQGRSMYSCVTCDAIKSNVKVQDIIGRLVPFEDLPSQDEFLAKRPGATRWTSACPLPRVICMNLMLPYETGLVPWGPWRTEDPGASFVAFFHIGPDTVSSSMSKEPPPEVKQLIDFFAGPAGLPLGPRDDPDRTLASRLQPGKKKDIQSGIFKANAKCLNPEDVNVPEMLHEYNGKPCLITKSGYIVKDPDMEWVEIGIDVRGWNVLVRKMLCSYRDMIPRTKVHFGFLVQGIDDDELPEGLMCDVYVYGANIIDNPAKIRLES